MHNSSGTVYRYAGRAVECLSRFDLLVNGLIEQSLEPHYVGTSRLTEVHSQCHLTFRWVQLRNQQHLTQDDQQKWIHLCYHTHFDHSESDKHLTRSQSDPGKLVKKVPCHLKKSRYFWNYLSRGPEPNRPGRYTISPRPGVCQLAPFVVVRLFFNPGETSKSIDSLNS